MQISEYKIDENALQCLLSYFYLSSLGKVIPLIDVANIKYLTISP